jgi:hypothetical protein
MIGTITWQLIQIHQPICWVTWQLLQWLAFWSRHVATITNTQAWTDWLSLVNPWHRHQKIGCAMLPHFTETSDRLDHVTSIAQISADRLCHVLHGIQTALKISERWSLIIPMYRTVYLCKRVNLREEKQQDVSTTLCKEPKKFSHTRCLFKNI